jgi:hypothetical protein
MHRLGSCSCASHYRWFDKGASARREIPLIGVRGSANRVRLIPDANRCLTWLAFSALILLMSPFFCCHLSLKGSKS